MEYENYSSDFPQELSQQTAANRVLSALKDKMFLAICILMSAFCLISLSFGNVPLIEILATIFLWLTYAKSCKDIADAEHLRCISGTIYAEYVITYVAAGLVLVLGVLSSVILSVLFRDGMTLESLVSSFVDVDEAVYTLLESIISASSVIILMCCVIAAAIAALINFFTLRYIHRFVQSVYQSVQANSLSFKYTNAAKICLFVLSGCSALSTLSSIGSVTQALGSACTCAATLLGGLLIHKYFKAEK